ncbi:MAG: FRG domain-containing protein [bacterium]|nr:FRG domain-containing protein [bacterium]
MMERRYAGSLEEIYHHMYDISRKIKETDKKSQQIFWFRGHAVAAYNLNPNIFRGTDYQYNENQTYSNNHLREDYRFQSFMARNFDNVDYKMPQYVIEWQEVMQHFFAKTRLMDWSESLTVALEFALESFINPIKDEEISRRCKTAEPVIWILRPNMLNEEVYHSFITYPELVNKAMLLKKDNLKRASKIIRELQREEESGIYYDIKSDNEQNFNRVIGLSALEMEREAYKGREIEAVENFEINPFFYLLLRYYSDGIPVEFGKLPPLAVIHPYHSQRIKMQKGVFTVFPYYIPDVTMQKIKEKTNKHPPFGMEYMEQCIPNLYQIHIVDPERVANELMRTGAKRGNIYPDMQNIALDMENAV